MEAEAFLDTHVILWLFAGEIERLGDKSRELIDNPANPLLISPISVLEMDYLHEIGKINSKGSKIAKKLSEDCDVAIAVDPFESVITSASKLDWTRDVFDRVLVAHSLLRKALLITKDRLIHKHYSRCVW